MAVWNPWRGCHRRSEGCRYCYIHKGDAKRGVDTNVVKKNESFHAPVQKYVRGKNAGTYKIKGGQLVYVCFRSDFLLEDADEWRADCWKIMKERPDLDFLFLTKRIERFAACVPEDWGDGYDNVIVGCTVENQKQADLRLNIFNQLPIKHKMIICQPMLEAINISGHLQGIELVEVGGESDREARVLDYAWVLDIRRQCIEAGVKFSFRQCGSHFVRDGVQYNLNVRELISQAKKANIDT